MRALYAGSFDPPTLGHLDVIVRAAALVDELVVGVGVNPAKVPYLASEERVALLASDCVAAGLAVTVTAYQGATVHFARSQAIGVLVRGLRSYADMNKERGMAEINRRSGFETLFLMARSAHTNLSSSLVRQVVGAGLELEGLVSPAVAEACLRRGPALGGDE